MAMSDRNAQTPADVTQDWREAWSSEADIRTGEPQRAEPPDGIFTPTPDAVASALDEFLPEAPWPTTPPAAHAMWPMPTVQDAPPARDFNPPRLRVVPVAAATLLFAAALVIGFLGPLGPAAEDSLGPPVSPAPPEDAARPGAGQVASRSLQSGATPLGTDLGSDRQVGGTRESARTAPARSVPAPPRQLSSEPPATPPARRPPPAANTAPLPVRSPIAARGGTPSSDGAVPGSSAPALDISRRDPIVAPVAAPPLRPAPAVNVSVSPTVGTAPVPLPEPPPPTVTPVEAAAPAPPTDRQAIQAVLGQYQAAYNRLDANGVRAIWPSLNAAALERAFGQVERQAVTFSVCSVAIIGAGATARCQGSARYVPKVGNRTERVDHRQWEIDLRKSGDRWRIVGVDSRE